MYEVDAHMQHSCASIQAADVHKSNTESNSSYYYSSHRWQNTKAL
jgi:hypothetical protein